MGGKLIRKITGGHFDHVAMILKFEIPGGDENEIYMFDATSDEGVSMNKWSTIRDFIGIESNVENNLY